MGKENWFIRMVIAAKRLVTRTADSVADSFCDWAYKKAEVLIPKLTISIV